MSSWIREALLQSSNDVGAAAASTPNRLRIIELKAAYTKACDDVRGDISLSELGKQQLIARAWVNTRAEIGRLSQADFDGMVARYNTLERRVFGTAADSSGADAVSFRDAVDRASKLEDEAAAAKLLGTAELSGDTILAKAVVMRAWEARWNDVVDHYAVNHAAVADALAELVSLRRSLDSRVSRLGGALGASLPRPTEIADLSLSEVQSYAEAEPSLSASHVLNNRFGTGITPTQERQAREQAIAEARNLR